MKTYVEILNELNEVRFRLEEANDTIEAIRLGEIDALVVKGIDGHQLYTLKSADQTYRIFIEQMTEGAITLNTIGNISYCNSQFAKQLGLPLEKVIGQPFYKFIAPADEMKCDQLIMEAWQNNTKGELNLILADGQFTPFLLSLKTLDLDEGLSLSIILTDLTAQKETQRLLQEKNRQLEEAQRIARDLNANLEKTVKERTSELRSNQEQLSRILETMAEGVVIINIKGKLTYANPMAKKILGFKKNEDIENAYRNPNWKYLNLDGSLLTIKEHPVYVAMKTDQAVYDYEIGIQPPAKEVFYISVNAAPIHDESGMIIGSIGTFMDVTNRRKAIQQKDDFISVASHELKTPITSLKASLQLLDRMKDKPGAMLPRLIEQANKSMQKVSNLIEDLLNASKVTEGHLHLNKATFKLANVIEESCQHVISTGDFKIILDGDYGLEVFGDPVRIEQVVVNFINNATKYALGTNQIDIMISQDGQDAKVAVKDYGQGIAADKLPHLFDRYYRVDDTGFQYSGLGLGLYICAEIIKKHNGKIGAESAPGKGSTFWFTLPLAITVSGRY